MNILIESWVWWTLLAVSMQAVRTAGQKQLSQVVTPLAATLVRYLYGLPFALIWCCFLVFSFDLEIPELPFIFYWSGLVAGLFQIIATVLLIRLFSLRNFAVGTTYVKSEILLTALIGFSFFAETISPLGFIAIFICATGLIIISLSKAGGLGGFWNPSAATGLGSGLCFALTSLFLRQASLSLDVSSQGDLGGIFSASITLLYMVTLQTVVCVVLVLRQQKGELSRVFVAWRPALFVGCTGVMGSIGWFTAMTLELASYVKTLGQVEFVLTLAIAVFYFKERPTKAELLGMVLILIGGMMLLIR